MFIHFLISFYRAVCIACNAV